MNSRGPGPGAYLLPPTVGFTNHDVRKQRRPQYSFGIQCRNEDKPIGPGPGVYHIENLTRYGTDGTPRYTMRPKTRRKDNTLGPGPAGHDVHKKPFFKGSNAPAYSLQSKHFIVFDNEPMPAPNAYKFGVHTIKPSPPVYSMGITLPRKPDISSPGPAKYGCKKFDVKLNRNPAYSMTGRNLYEFKKCSPGPVAYNIASYTPGRKGNAYSFGTRHSENSSPLIVPCDNWRC